MMLCGFGSNAAEVRPRLGQGALVERSKPTATHIDSGGRGGGGGRAYLDYSLLDGAHDGINIVPASSQMGPEDRVGASRSYRGVFVRDKAFLLLVGRLPQFSPRHTIITFRV